MSKPPLFTPRPTMYRAWDGRKLVTVQTLCWNRQGMIWYGAGNQFGWAYVYPDSDGWTDDNPKPGDADICPVMQWTEMKDKNGRDIYEGDILDADRFDENNGPWRGVIERSYTGFHVFHVSKGEISREYGPAILEFRRPFTVVGNVFENPDLLKG